MKEKEILIEIETLEKKLIKAKETIQSIEWDLAFAKRNLGSIRMTAIRAKRENK